MGIKGGPVAAARPHVQAVRTSGSMTAVLTQRHQKKAKSHTHLSSEQQVAVVAWLRLHEVLYNKKMEAYKDTRTKQRLWNEQARLMDISVDELKLWYTSLRTRFTKLQKKEKKSSGDGPPSHTERDLWVLDNFNFLAPFTYEVRKRPLVSIKSLMAPPHPPKPPTSQEKDDDDIRPSDHQADPDIQHNTTGASSNPSTASTPKSSVAASSISSLNSKLDDLLAMQRRVLQQIVRPDKDRMKEVFIDYIRESVYEISACLWEAMHRDIVKTVLRYTERDSDMKRGRSLLTCEQR